MPAEPVAAIPDDSPERALRSLLVSATGNTRLAGSEGQVAEKLRRRLAVTGLADPAAYLEFVVGGRDGGTELDALIAELTIGETSFFRHPDQFAMLRNHVLPACLERNRQSRHLRIWSAGCANGAETYSIAIAVQSVLAEAAPDWQITIVGSDINTGFLAEAEAGLYSKWTLRDLSAAQLRAHFTPENTSWRIKDRYRGSVRFVAHNLVTGDCPSLHQNIFGFDIVFCRNVMIYFADAANVAVTAKLHGALRDGGWLFVAPSDIHSHLGRAFACERLAGGVVHIKTPPPPATASRAHHSDPGRSPAPAPEATAASRRAARPRSRRRATGTPLPAGVPAILEAANRADWNEARRACDALLARDVCDPEAHYCDALIRQFTGQTRAAEQALKRALYLDPGFALAHYQLADMRLKVGDRSGYARALSNAIEALAGIPDDARVSSCGQVTALDLRTLAASQLGRMALP